ncbi:MAG TPA: hypothetical protein VMU59_11495 [Caulobacteraceae bacterium]|nr:hypothetical protein [Caulobacteraceae bacterium]
MTGYLPTPHLAPLLALGLALLFGVADRLAGGSYIAAVQAWVSRQFAAHVSLIGTLLIDVANARSTFWAGLLLCAVLAAVHPSWAWFGLAWTVWRWDGWTAFGGDMDPASAPQALGLFLRHLLAAGVILASLATGHGVLMASLLVAIFALQATLLGVLLHEGEATWPGLNAVVEFTRGALFGFFVALILSQ